MSKFIDFLAMNSWIVWLVVLLITSRIFYILGGKPYKGKLSDPSKIIKNGCYYVIEEIFIANPNTSDPPKIFLLRQVSKFVPDVYESAAFYVSEYKLNFISEGGPQKNIYYQADFEYGVAQDASIFRIDMKVPRLLTSAKNAGMHSVTG